MKRVLVVDDAQFMRYQLRKILESNGFEVIGEAENGVAAIKKYNELKPDLITMDITMPEKSGIEALIDIKKIDKNCKIIMISSMSQESFVREAISSGADDFILKPFKEESVLLKINKVLGIT